MLTEDDKQLALIFDFDKAPTQVQEAAKAANEASKVLQKATKKLNEQVSAQAIAAGAKEKADKALRLALKAWNPEAGI